MSLCSIQKCKVTWGKHCTWSAESKLRREQPLISPQGILSHSSSSWKPLWQSDLVTTPSVSFATNSFQGTNKFKFWKFFFRAQADKVKKSNLCGVPGVSFIPFHLLDYGTNIHYLTEYSSPSVLDRGNPSKQQACKILNILWNLSEVKHLTFRDSAIYKS